MPPEQDCVRMEVYLGRFVVEQVAGDVRLAYISQADPMGMIPNFVKNLAIDRQAGRPAQIY